MNQFIAIHRHQYGETLYTFRSSHSEDELRDMYVDEDGNITKKFETSIGMESSFEPELGDTLAFHELIMNDEKNPVID